MFFIGFIIRTQMDTITYLPESWCIPDRGWKKVPERLLFNREKGAGGIII